MRPEAEETFVICRAPDRCLWAYPLDAWEEYEDQLDSMPFTKERDRLHRLIQSSSTESALDKQGRITISQLQMEITGIKKSVTIIGRRKYIEIWDTEKFEEYMGSDDNFDDIFYKAHEGLAK